MSVSVCTRSARFVGLSPAASRLKDVHDIVQQSVAIIFGQPFVKRFALCYRTVVCPVLSVLSVTLVYCAQTVGQMQIKLGMQLGLGPGHIVLNGDPGPPPPKGHSFPIFVPYLLWPNGSMD